MSNFDTIGDLPTISDGELLANRYRILRKLGEGGMGTVFLAEDTELGNNKVAIKFIPPQLAGNARAIKNLQREAQTAMQLSHPNIVRLHDMHTDGHQKFLVMEYIEGKTLDDLLAEKADSKMTLEELLPIAEQIANGLDYAHGKKVLHRDLKPSNIMIDKNGLVKLLDFGIAREMKDSYTRVTGQETSGTLPYMSPEQLRGQPPSASMDIYSFAAVLYECLSGHPPFYTGDLRHQILNEEPLFIDSAPEGFNQSLRLGLSKDLDKRPESAFQLINRGPRFVLNKKPASKSDKSPCLIEKCRHCLGAGRCKNGKHDWGNDYNSCDSCCTHFGLSLNSKSACAVCDGCGWILSNSCTEDYEVTVTCNHCNGTGNCRSGRKDWGTDYYSCDSCCKLADLEKNKRVICGACDGKGKVHLSKKKK
jgi:serine/threonine protein kinase